MAEQVVWGVRVSEEFKERIAKVIEQSGLKAQDYLENLIDQYQLNRVKDNPLLQADITELQMLTARINNIYINVSERIQMHLEDKEIKQQEVLAQKNSDLDAALNRIEELKQKCQELETSKSSVEAENKEHIKRIRELEEMGEANKALVAEYKEKNDTLAGLMNEYKGFKDENSKLCKVVESERQLLRETEEKTKTMELEIVTLKNVLKETQEKHVDAVDALKERTAIEKDKAILELTIKQQQHVQEIIDQNNNKIKELLAKIEVLSEANTKDGKETSGAREAKAPRTKKEGI